MDLSPKPGAPINDFFLHLVKLKNEIASTLEEISDIAFRTKVFCSMPTSFKVTVKIRTNQTYPLTKFSIAYTKEKGMPGYKQTLPLQVTHSTPQTREYTETNRPQNMSTLDFSALTVKQPPTKPPTVIQKKGKEAALPKTSQQQPVTIVWKRDISELTVNLE